MSESAEHLPVNNDAADSAANTLAKECAQLREENAQLRTRLADKASYVRRKIDQMLKVMGTLPLRPEELDDDTLVELDPLGILAESFSHILDHLHDTNRELTEKREFLQTIFASLESGIILVRAEDHVITDANQTALRIIGRQRKDVIGQVCFRFICPKCAGTCPMEDRELTIDSAERSILAVDGSEIPVLKTVGRVILHGVPHYVESFVDITAQKQAEKKILSLNEELEQRVEKRTTELAAANRELESFCYSVSHDLRAPLRHINAFTTILNEEHSTQLDHVGRTHLQRVCAASKRMGMLIDDLLLFSRVSRTKKNWEHVNLSQLAESIVTMFRESEPERTVQITIEQGLVARGDNSLLTMVLQNLIGNAWKYTANRQDAAITVGKTVVNGREAYFVSDNGIGFDMAYKDKLFKVFERLHGEEFEGTGIGLATVQRIISRHDGEVWAEAELNVGAIFYFTLGAFTSSSFPT